MKFICALVLICFLAGCFQPTKKEDNINKIEIATSGCLRGCPVIGISIDSSLAFRYYGGYKAKLQGYYSGVVTRGFWNTLNIKLKKISFKTLDTSKDYPIDGEVAEAIFYWNNQKRHIFKSIDADPDSVSHVLIWIINSYKNIELNKLKDSGKFETRYQYMMPPKPNLHQIIFPPPKRQ